MRLAATSALAAGMIVAGCVAAGAQAPAEAQQPAPAAAAQAAPTQTEPAQAVAVQVAAGGRLHGVAMSGKIPLPGVTVTAQNTLTGKRYSTTTDVTGAWSLTIPQNGRYVIRTQFAGFAMGSQEALLNATNHDQTVNFDLMLASRAAEQQAREGTENGTGLNASAAQAIVGEELTLTYDSERQRLAGLGPDVSAPVFERSGDLPCTRIVAQQLRTNSPHGLQLLWSPAVMDFIR